MNAKLIVRWEDEVGQLGEMRMEQIPNSNLWAVDIGIEAGHEVRLYHRTVLPLEDHNSAALIFRALATLPEEAFVGPISPSDLARRQPGSLLEIQAGPSELHHNRSAVWGGQSEQHGSDSGG